MPLFLSVAVAGLVGSISHCSVMCSPLVAAQMLDMKKRKQSQYIILYYHAGRIVTYMLLGSAAFGFSHWLFSGGLQHFSSAMLLAAGVLFLSSARLPRKTHHCCSKKTQRLQWYIERLRLPMLIYFLRGVLMGFMPCGMIIAVLMAVATLTHLYEAMLAMVVFGLTTVPVLQLAGYGSLRLSRRYPVMSQKAGRVVMACNGLFLCGLGLNLVSVN